MGRKGLAFTVVGLVHFYTTKQQVNHVCQSLNYNVTLLSLNTTGLHHMLTARYNSFLANVAAELNVIKCVN